MNNTDLSSLVANARKSLIANQQKIAQNAALSYEFGHRYEARTADAVEKLNENQTLQLENLQLHIETQKMQIEELRRQADAQEAQLKELHRQADAQTSIDQGLREEAISRAKDDKKYFWLGALVSFIISMLVEHGPTLIEFLQQLFPQ